MNLQTNMNTDEKRGGFTLLELLIVVSIIAILSVALIFVLNPAETLRKSRDAQRIADLATMKSSLGIYTTSTTSPQLAGTNNTACKAGSGSGTYAASDLIYYSLSSASDITDTLLDGSSTVDQPAPSQVAAANLNLTDGTGWLPVNFDSLIGGSPISNLPIDPVNVISSLTAVSGVAGANPPDYVYRYACNSSSLTYEIDAILESETYTVTDNKMAKDGGNNSAYYEVGTNLKILGTGTDF